MTNVEIKDAAAQLMAAGISVEDLQRMMKMNKEEQRKEIKKIRAKKG